MKSYVIPCPSPFRRAVLDLAERRGLTATEIALGVLSLIDPETIDEAEDPGEPQPGDRETVELKSGPRKGRALTRKPRLQVRLPAGLAHDRVRRALALAIDLDAGRQHLSVCPPVDVTQQSADLTMQQEALTKAQQALEEMRATVDIIAFDAEGQGIASTAQASYILGLPPGTPLDRELVKSRFRQLSRVFHPDRPTGDTARMSRLIEAVRYLEAKLPRRFEFKPVNWR